MEISVQELKERLEKGEKVNLIDVREEWEFEELRIDGAININLCPCERENIHHSQNITTSYFQDNLSPHLLPGDQPLGRYFYLAGYCGPELVRG